MNFKKKQMALAVAGIAGALSVQGALAAETAVLEGVVLDEVIVTAQKVSENLQKIPVSVTSISAETLRETGIASYSDLQQLKVPGFNMQPFAGRSELMQVTMRGIFTGDPGQGTVDAGVAIVMDDVYNARGLGVGFSPAELERVEILRGPQGTLFGRNAVGGAIRMVTKGPTGEFGGNVKLGVTNYNGTSAEAHLNTPEVNGLSFKFDLKEMKHDGFTKNPSSPSGLNKHHDFGEVEGEGGKISAQLKATDKLKFNYSYEDSTYKTTTTYAQHLAPPAVCQGGVACVGTSILFAIPPTNVGDYPGTAWMGMYAGPSHTKFQNHRLGIEWQLQDNLTLKSITSHTEAELQIHDNILNGAYSFTSFGGANIAAIGRRTPAAFGSNGIAAAGLTGPNQIYGLSGVLPWANVASKTSSQEFQLIGKTDTVKWIGGLYWFQEKARDIRTTAFTLAYTGFAGGRPINPVATNPFYLTTNAGPDDSSKTDTQDQVDAYALFGQATWTPASMQRLHLTGGLRYSNDKRTFHRSVENGLPVSIDKPDFDLSRVDPLVSLNYDLNDTTIAYARYSSAYRAGGASVRLTWSNPTLGRFATYDKEVDKTIEAGIKTELMDRRLRLNAATFFTNSIGPILTVQLDSNQPSITGTINLPGTQKIKGVELEAAFAATKRLTLSGNLTWQKYEPSSEVDNYILTTDPGAAYGFGTPFPKLAGGVMADYVMPMPVGQLAFHIDWNKTSKAFPSSRIPRGSFAPDIWNDVTNARVTWRNIQAGSTTFAVSAFGKNLRNTHTAVFTAPGGTWVTSDPRMYGLEVSMDF